MRHITLAGIVMVLAAGAACEHKTTPAQPTPLPCAFVLSASSLTFDAAGGSASVTVTAGAGCAWTAASDRAWMSIVSGATGSGNGAVEVSVAANASTSERTGTLTIADQGVAVRVDAHEPKPPPHPPDPPPPPPPPPTPTCEYSVAPVTVAVCMSVPYDLTTTITTANGCSWTAAAGASWISMKNESGSGTAAIRFTVSDNWEAPRSGVVMIRWPTPTAGQNVQIAQAGCRYAVSVSTMAVDAEGGARTFDVYQQSDPLECGGPLQDGCVWTVQSSVPWITLSSPATQRGDQRVSFVVAANPSTAPRTGVITVRDKTVSITQAGR